MVAVIVIAATLSSYTQSASGASGGLTLDGSGFKGEQHQYTPLTVSLTTANPDDIIVLYVETVGNQLGCYSMTSVSDAAGLTWYERGSQACFFYSAYNVYYSVEEFWALSSGVLYSDAINATTSSYGNNGAVVAYAIHGANTTDPFDDNDRLPSFTTLAFATVSTSNPSDFVLGINYEPDPYGSYGAGAGFTGVFVDTDVNWATEYEITSASRSGLVMAYDAPADLTILAAADAVCGAGGSHCVAPTTPAPTTVLTTTAVSTTLSSSRCVTGPNYVSCSKTTSSVTTNTQTKSASSSLTTGQTSAPTVSSSFESQATTPESSSSTTQSSPGNVSSPVVSVALLVLTVTGVGVAIGLIERRVRNRRLET
jgi:hypothetical protein